jgi:hypothetical protein
VPARRVALAQAARLSQRAAEIGPEVSAFIHKPGTAPVVLGTEWLVGQPCCRCCIWRGASAFAYSPLNIAALAAATAVPNIRLDFAVGHGSSHRRREPISTEVIITLDGDGADGRRYASAMPSCIRRGSRR